MFIKRSISPILLESKKSTLLLGPRQTGKSTLIKKFKADLSINLADQEQFLAHLKNPALIKELCPGHKTVFIDEVQRIPSLLNTLQHILDNEKNSPKFFLTGSSARKLRRGQANLLPGRIIVHYLSPLLFKEIEKRFETSRALSLGCLPGAWDNESSEKEWKKILRSYSATYLKEEIQAEALSRDLEGFSRFFEVMISRSGNFIDFTKFSSEAMISRSTAKRYFDIFSDTLLIHTLSAFKKSSRMRLVQHPRYYLFDVGVLNACLGNFKASSDRIGNLFEHLFVQQIYSAAHASDREIRLTTFRNDKGSEVDFILEISDEVYAIELKASKNISDHDTRGLKSFAKFYDKKHHSVIAYLGDKTRKNGEVSILPWKKLLEKIF